MINMRLGQTAAQEQSIVCNHDHCDKWVRDLLMVLGIVSRVFQYQDNSHIYVIKTTEFNLKMPCLTFKMILENPTNG